MSSSILHVQDDFVLDVDFTPTKMLNVLDVITTLAVPFRNRTIDATTSLGEYHYSLTIDALQALFLEKEDIINCVTISENRPPGEIPASLVVYIRQIGHQLKTSFTISSTSEEQNQILEELLIDDLEKLQKERAKSTEFSISDTFQFDQRITRKQLSRLILQIDERVFPNQEIEIDILSKSDELILIGDSEVSKLKDHLWEEKRKIVCINKNCNNGSSFDLFLFFEQDRNGFAYLEMASNSKGKIQQIKSFISKELELNVRQQKSLKSKLANRPYLQQQFEINGALEADQIIDFFGTISKRLLKEVEMELRFISPSHKTYCYSESDCKVLRKAFRYNRRGILVASKRFKDLYEVKVCINFRSLTKSVAYCYLTLPTSQENVTAFNIIKGGLQPELRNDKPARTGNSVVQDAFYFDPTISAGQLIWFVKMIDHEFLKDEITNIRLTTLNGDQHYFYNEEYLDIIDLFEQKIHDSVYINKQAPDGQSITINLQFHGQPDIPNCFYSINFFKKEEASLLKTKIIKILQNYQEEGPHNSEEQIDARPVQVKVALHVPDSKIRKNWVDLLSDLDYEIIHLKEDDSGVEMLETLSEVTLVLLDVNQSSQRIAFMVGMARGTGQRIILLADKAKRLPLLFKGLSVLHYDSDPPNFEDIKSDFSDLMVI